MLILPSIFAEPLPPSLKNPWAMREGHLDTFPRTSLPSFSSENALIIWQLFLPGPLVSLRGGS